MVIASRSCCWHISLCCTASFHFCGSAAMNRSDGRDENIGKSLTTSQVPLGSWSVAWPPMGSHEHLAGRQRQRYFKVYVFKTFYQPSKTWRGNSCVGYIAFKGYLSFLLYIELTLFWLAGKCTVNFWKLRLLHHEAADYTIIVSRTLKVTGNHVMVVHVF